MNTSRRTETNGASVRLALVANGTSGPWDISIDESTDAPERYFAQLEGPRVILYFELPSLRTVQAAIDYLQRCVKADESRTLKNRAKESGALRLGTFGRAPVHLAWDDEHEDRCFLSVGVAKPCLRLAFAGDEIGHVAAALDQVADDLKEAGLL